MQPSISIIGAICLAAGFASAQTSSTPAVTTITATPGCPSAAADVIVTRSGVVVPSCAAGNGTKASVVSISGYRANATASATGSAGLPQFTGAAARGDAMGAMAAIVGGAVVALFA